MGQGAGARPTKPLTCHRCSRRPRRLTQRRLVLAESRHCTSPRGLWLGGSSSPSRWTGAALRARPVEGAAAHARERATTAHDETAAAAPPAGGCGKGTRRVHLVRRDGRDVSTLYGREGEGGAVWWTFRVAVALTDLAWSGTRAVAGAGKKRGSPALVDPAAAGRRGGRCSAAGRGPGRDPVRAGPARALPPPPSY